MDRMLRPALTSVAVTSTVTLATTDRTDAQTGQAASAAAATPGKAQPVRRRSRWRSVRREARPYARAKGMRKPT